MANDANMGSTELLQTYECTPAQLEKDLALDRLKLRLQVDEGMKQRSKFWVFDGGRKPGAARPDGVRFDVAERGDYNGGVEVTTIDVSTWRYEPFHPLEPFDFIALPVQPANGKAMQQDLYVVIDRDGDRAEALRVVKDYRGQYGRNGNDPIDASILYSEMPDNRRATAVSIAAKQSFKQASDDFFCKRALAILEDQVAEQEQEEAEVNQFYQTLDVLRQDTADDRYVFDLRPTAKRLPAGQTRVIKKMTANYDDYITPLMEFDLKGFEPIPRNGDDLILRDRKSGQDRAFMLFNVVSKGATVSALAAGRSKCEGDVGFRGKEKEEEDRGFGFFSIRGSLATKQPQPDSGDTPIGQAAKKLVLA